MSARLVCLHLLIALGPGVRASEETFPGIEALMSPEEFAATGLERLSSEELAALDAWLLRFTAGDAGHLQARNEAVREARRDVEVVSRLVGDFDGWVGDTVFRLENGQVWRQRLDGQYAYEGPPNPQVRISRNILGFFRLTVLETGKSIGVSRID